MPASRHVTFFHAHPSRSTCTHVLLEELGADYEIRPLNLADGDNLKPEFLAINPLGKVPTIVHDGAVITEQVAVFQYLAELYPEAALAPQVGDPDRGPWLRWLAIYGCSFEPAMVDRSMQREPGRRAMSGYGSFDGVVELITQQLSRSNYLLGERFSAVDLLWGMGLHWMTLFGLFPANDTVRAYCERIVSRPAVKRVEAFSEK